MSKPYPSGSGQPADDNEPPTAPATTDVDDASPEEPTSPKHRRTVRIAAGGILALLMLTAVAYGISQTLNSATRLEDVKEACAPNSNHIRTADNGKSLIITGAGAEEGPGANLGHVVCVFAEVDMPEAVRAQVGGTRALDGRQHGSWDGFDVSWTYHPNSGLDVILQETS